MWTERGARRLPELMPYPGQADQALHLVHVRRRRSAAVVASMAGAAVVASLLVSARGSGSAIIAPADPIVSRTATASPSQDAMLLAGPVVVGSAGRTGRVPAGAPPSTYGGATTATASAAGAAASASAATVTLPDPTPKATSGRHRSPVHRDHFEGSFPCARIGPWCGSVTKDDSAAGGEQLRLLLCHPTLQDPARLTFETHDEVDFAIFPKNDQYEVWRWSAGMTWPRRPHVLVASAGTCYSWTTPWNGLGDDGRRLPRGEYTIEGTVLADEYPETVTGSFQVW